MTDPTARFSARADVYARARPSYPSETIATLQAHHGLSAEAVVAELGAGTGIFTRLLAPASARVYAVEPNADMRGQLGADPRITVVDGRAEATTLSDASVDLVVAAQAFHWFDVTASRREHARILRGAKRAAFVWNDRDLAGTPFLERYEAILLEHCPGYRELQGKSDTPDKFDAYFGARRWTRHTARQEQALDREGLVARVRSASYAPKDDAALVRALDEAFDRHAEDGAITIGYTTVVIGGTITSPSSGS